MNCHHLFFIQILWNYLHRIDGAPVYKFEFINAGNMCIIQANTFTWSVSIIEEKRI